MVNRNDSRRDSRKDCKKDDIEDQLVATSQVIKVVKGGRQMGFATVVIVGDRKGHVGFGTGKAQEAPEIIRKAVEAGEKRMTKIPTVGTTVSHEVMGHRGFSSIMLKPVEVDSGAVAGGAVRIIMDLAGVLDVTSKSLGPNTLIDAVRATMDGLSKLEIRENVLKLRGSVKSLED